MRQAGAGRAFGRPPGRIPVENRALQPSPPSGDSSPALERPVNEMPRRNGGRDPSSYLLELFGGVGRGGLALALALAEASAGTRMTGRQVDVPPVGKFEIARNDASGATLDDESRAVGKLAWETVDLAHEILA